MEELYNEFQRRFKDILEIDFPAWLLDLQNFEPYSDIDPKIAEELLEMKKNDQLTRKMEREGVLGYTEIRNSSPLILKIVQPFIVSF